MAVKEDIKSIIDTVIQGTLHSYSMVFFLNNRFLAAVIMLTSFFNFYAGLSGLIATLTVLLIGYCMNLDKNVLRNGTYSFNALLLGIGMGSFYEPSYLFFCLLLIASLFTLILSVTMGGWFTKSKLPFLSIPFVLSFWLIIISASYFENLGLSQRNIYWLNEMYAVGGKSLLNIFQIIDSLPINKLLDLYLRSISSIFFQSNLITGFVIAIALLISSRISFVLSIIGFFAAYLFALFSGSELTSMTYYNIGANYMMVAFAIGGFFIIPSKQSFFWTIVLIPLTSLVLLFCTKLVAGIQLPVFSLPFSIVVILFIYFLEFRKKATGLVLTPLQHYSPEKNLYTYNNNKERLARFLHLPLHLPFWGEWTVSQGHDGEYTHKDDWGKAFDFMIFDEDGKTYSGNGLKCEQYHCYNKPIVAPADGLVEVITDGIDDNEIGTVNTTENWGNSIIIRHATGLYTQISHLKKGTFKVTVGESVKLGQILANCGNSGRSPQPHIHFQVQTAAVIGSKTIDYPFAYYYFRNNSKTELIQYSTPSLNQKISKTTANQELINTFNIIPGTLFAFSYMNKHEKMCTEEWEAFTDAYNHKYLYCKSTDSTAYYTLDGSSFYFTAFYGNKNSLLYYFFLSAYKIFLDNEQLIEIKDFIPLNLTAKNHFINIINDLVSPFFNFVRVNYQQQIVPAQSYKEHRSIVLNSSINISTFNKNKKQSQSAIIVNENGIQSFEYKSKKTSISATCIKYC